MALILFSPLGGTDPISFDDEPYDGSMLHITRVYKPDKIYLYMTEEILKKHREDDRYNYCLKRLWKLQNRAEPAVEIIERPGLIDVQEYDYFYRDFREILDKIQKENSGDELLINVSSGTPAMKSALLVLITLLNYSCKALQVVTPKRGMNNHDHKNYDVEFCWAYNKDNEPNCENRVNEVRCPTLSTIQIENVIREHIGVYDYQAALKAAELLPQERKDKYLDYIEMGAVRFLLSHMRVCKLRDKTGYDCYPYNEEKQRQLFEYLLALQIREERKLYADFVRALTPAFYVLFLRIMKTDCGPDPDQCMVFEADGKHRWKKDAVEKEGLTEHLRDKRTGAVDYLVKTEQLQSIISSRCKDGELIKLCNTLRDIEKNIRNRVAHQIIEVTDQVIKNKTGYTTKEIMELIKKASAYAGFSAKGEEWDSYDKLNEVICSRMDEID